MSYYVYLESILHSSLITDFRQYSFEYRFLFLIFCPHIFKNNFGEKKIKEREI